MVVTNKVVITKELFEASPNIKMVAETATGYNNIGIEYAKAHQIRVANVAGYSTESVVQHTFALLFYVYEKLRYYDEYVKSGEYVKSTGICRYALVESKSTATMTTTASTRIIFISFASDSALDSSEPTSVET